jgi:hypothetical protein
LARRVGAVGERRFDRADRLQLEALVHCDHLAR